MPDASDTLHGEGMFRQAPSTGWRSLRPERPLPEELQKLLDEVVGGRRPEGARVLRPRRRLRKGSWAVLSCAVFVVLFAPLLIWVTWTAPLGTRLWVLVCTVVMLVLIAVAVVRGMRWDLRRSDPHRFLVVTPRFVASVGDELGVQWAGAWELESISAHGATSGSEGGTSSPPYIELVFRNGETEEIFVDPVLENEELYAWASLIIRVLEYERD